MKIFTLLKEFAKMQHLIEMERHELESAIAVLNRLVFSKHNLVLRDTTHAVQDRLVHGDRKDVTAEDLVKTIAELFRQDRHLEIMERRRQGKKRYEVLVYNLNTGLNVVLSIKFDQATKGSMVNVRLVTAGITQKEWGTDRSYRETVRFKVRA